MNHIQHAVWTLFPQIHQRFPGLEFVHSYREAQARDEAVMRSCEFWISALPKSAWHVQLAFQSA